MKEKGWMGEVRWDERRKDQLGERKRSGRSIKGTVPGGGGSQVFGIALNKRATYHVVSISFAKERGREERKRT